MNDFREYLAQQLQDPKFKAEWDALEPEYQRARAMIDASQRKGPAQKPLANLMETTQADVRP